VLRAFGLGEGELRPPVYREGGDGVQLLSERYG